MISKDAQGAIHESRALKSRVHLAEAAQKEARNMELDYEEVVRLLESEVAELREQLKERPLPKKVSSGKKKHVSVPSTMSQPSLKLITANMLWSQYHFLPTL